MREEWDVFAIVIGKALKKKRLPKIIMVRGRLYDYKDVCFTS